MLDVASDNTSLLSAQIILEFLGRIVEHPDYRKRHPMKARRAVPARAPSGGRRSGRRGRARS